MNKCINYEKDLACIQCGELLEDCECDWDNVEFDDEELEF